MTITQLENHLLDYDGHAVSILSEARIACRECANYFEDLIRLCFDPRPIISNGATWMLKAEFEDGEKLSAELTAQLIASLEKLQSWQSVLHICQAVEGFELTAAQANVFAKWGAQYADHSRPFVRAWSLHVRAVLGRQFETLQQDAERALTLAEKDPAASVKARARQLRKKAHSSQVTANPTRCDNRQSS